MSTQDDKSAAEGEAEELARQLGAVAQHCSVIMPWVLSFRMIPPEVKRSARQVAEWLEQVKPPHQQEKEQ